MALLKASKVLDGYDTGSEDQNIGVKIVKNALSYPLKQIAENAGKEASVVAAEVEKNADTNYGYDAAKDEYVDMIASGIIDPKKVERVALEEAVSLAGMFLTTESGVVKAPEKEEGHHHHHDHGMSGMGMY